MSFSLPNFIASEIAVATRVVSDAALAQPGKPVNLSVIADFSPEVAAVMSPLTSPLNGINLTVSYSVTREDGQQPSYQQINRRSNPLTEVSFLLEPPIGEDTRFTAPIRYHILVTISVSVGTGQPITQTVDVPVSMPALQIPSVALLCTRSLLDVSLAPGQQEFSGEFTGDPTNLEIPEIGADSHDGNTNIMVMVEAGSPAKSLSEFVGIINALMETIQDLQSVLDLTGHFFSVLNLIADGINKVPLVFFRAGNWPDMSDPGGLDEDMRSLVLLGVSRLQLVVCEAEDFDLSEDHRVFTVKDLDPPLNAVGFTVQNFKGLNYDISGNESMVDDGPDSARFGRKPF